MSNYIIHREEDEDYLEHFGVRGMHWGVRRYQNEDGSYKPGAEGRYAPDGQPGVNKKRSGGGSSASGTSKPKYGKDGMSDTERKLVFGPRGEKSIAYKIARKTGMIKDYDPEKLKKLNEDAARKEKEKADKKAAKEKEKTAKDAEKEAKNKQLQEIDGLSDTERKLMYGALAEKNPLWKMKYGKKADGDKKSKSDEDEADKKAAKEKEKTAKDAEKEAKNKQLQEIDGLSDTERKLMYGALAEKNPLWKMKYGKKADGDKKSKSDEEKADKNAAKEKEKAAKDAEKKQKQEEKTKYWQEQFKLAEQEEAARKEKKAAEKQAKEEAKAAKKAEKEAKNKQLQDIDGMTSAERKLMYGVLAENNPIWKKKYGGKLKQSDYSEYDYELYHHGILGMHWGIRRYQNEDGTLTAAGKKRYRTDEDLNKYGKTRKEVIDKLNKGSEKAAKKYDEYFDKSMYKKEQDAYERHKLLDDADFEYKESDFDNYKKRAKEVGLYDEENDKDYQISKRLSDASRHMSSDAKALGKNFVSSSTFGTAFWGAAVGSVAAYKYADHKGYSGKSFVTSMLTGAIGGMALSGLAGNRVSTHLQNKAEKKYGFR